MSVDDAFEVLRRLGNYETMTWREIDGPQSHGIPIGDLAKDARDRLVEISQDDAAEYFSLRVNSAARVWGIRDTHILRILWWDPDHQVCPSKTYRQ